MQVWLGNFYARIRPGLAIGSVTARCRTSKITDEGREINLGFQWNYYYYYYYYYCTNR